MTTARTFLSLGPGGLALESEEEPDEEPAFAALATGVPCAVCGHNEQSGERPPPNALPLCRKHFGERVEMARGRTGP